MAPKTRKFLDALTQDQILGTIPSGLFLVDNKRYIVYWNPEAERITGYPAAEMVGQHCSILEGIECGLGCSLFDAGSPDKPIIGAECDIRTKSGEKIFISKNVDFLRLDGEVVGGIESFVNISSQKKLEETLRLNSDELEKIVQKRTAALEEERTRVHTVLNGMTDLAYIVTDDYRLDFFNQPMKNVFGPSKGNICYEVLHNLREPCVECPWSKIKKGHSINEDREFRQNKRTYEVIHTPVYSPQGDLLKLAICRDITERKEATEKLMELNRHLDSFAYTVSHDLRSPLTPIIGYAEFLKEEYTEIKKAFCGEVAAPVKITMLCPVGRRQGLVVPHARAGQTPGKSPESESIHLLPHQARMRVQASYTTVPISKRVNPYQSMMRGRSRGKCIGGKNVLVTIHSSESFKK